MLKIILSGCSGKMGRVISEMVNNDDEVEIVAGIDLVKNERAGYPIYSSFDMCNEDADVIVDFSRPDTLQAVVPFAVKNHLPVVFATTGYNADQVQAINDLASYVPVFRSGNMSLGINLMLDLLKTSTKILGDDYDIEIIEKHHNQKVDAPSGTALMLADAINSAADNKYIYTYDRHEYSVKRDHNEIGMHSIRGGTIVGEHTVIFAGRDEFFEITHKAQSRDLFAIGALRAAKFLPQKSNGLYSMSDVISIERTVTQVYTQTDDAVINISNIEIGSRTTVEIFNAMSNAEINVDMISQPAPINGCVNLSFSIPHSRLHDAVAILENVVERRDVTIFEDVCKLSVEGIGMEYSHGAAFEFFSALDANDIPVYLITTSEVKIACCIPKKDTEKAKEVIKERFAII